MPRPSRLIVALGCLLLFGCGAQQSNLQRRLFDSHNLLRHAHFVGLGPISNGEVQPEQNQVLRASFAQDVCYVLAAFGGDGVNDLGLTVVGPDQSPIAEERGTGPTAIVSFCTERAGEHLVTVTAESGGGTFQLAYWFGQGDEGEGGPGGGNGLVLGRAVTGTLPPGQQFIDYTLNIRERRLVTIDLESRDFDTYLYLLREGTQLQRNDDGGVGLNSRIATPLDPGTYTIRVGSFMNRGSGQFTLVAR